MSPAFITFGLFGFTTFTALFSATLFRWLTAYLTFFALLWIFCACFFTMLSYLRIRQATKQDWQSMLEEVQQVDPDGSSVLHIVIIPNYKEPEKMLKETIETLGLSPMASTRVRVVLGMEAREGQAAHEKANRLIQQTQHLFSDMMATYHPEGLPGEVAGKSSNTQWAYREALRHYGPILLGYDLSRVFLTVCDADTLWHPQYFSALTYSGLMMSEEERVWRIWQPGVLLGRNHFSVPVLTRVSGLATVICELFNLSCPDKHWPSFAFSSYSLTLALASHPEVDGWDVDVIAEDYHMTCKCFFAALWDLSRIAKDASRQKDADNMEPVVIESRLLVEPIYLPAVSYLVESRDGYWASVMARFEQARRHIQGVVEIGYILLQYARLMSSVGHRNLPRKTHWAIIKRALKLYVFMIQTNCQGWSVIMGILVALPPAVASLVLRVWEGGFSSLFAVGASWGSVWQALDGTQQLLLYVICQVGGLTVVMGLVCSLVLIDLLSGAFYTVLPPVPPAAMPIAEGENDDDETNSTVVEQANANGKLATQGVPSFVEGSMGITRRIWCFVSVMSDFINFGFASMVFLSMFPLWGAAWSLFVRGTDFEYVVADKPEE